MGRDGRIVRLGHAGDQPDLGDPAGVAEVGLEDRGGALLQDLAEAPLGEDPLAGGDRQVGPAGDLGHDVVVLRLAGLLDEHRLRRLDGLDQELGQGRADEISVAAVSPVYASVPFPFTSSEAGIFLFSSPGLITVVREKRDDGHAVLTVKTDKGE